MAHFDIVCLANSRKLGGHCVAGLRLDGAGWVRPVGAPADGVLWPRDYTLTTGKAVRPLEVVKVSVRSHRPAPHQPENWVIDGAPWAPSACPARATLLSVLRQGVVAGPELLTGCADRVPYARFEKDPAAASLALVAPEDLYLYHHMKASGKLQAHGRFSLGAPDRLTLYDLPITEPHWQDAMRRYNPRTLRQADAKFLVTISLSEPYAEECYKLIAAIMPLPRYLGAEL